MVFVVVVSQLNGVYRHVPQNSFVNVICCVDIDSLRIQINKKIYGALNENSVSADNPIIVVVSLCFF